MNDGTITARARFVEPSQSDRIRAVSRPAQGRPIIPVLGMHRSGTSLCAHILSALGVDMADDIGAEPSNARGHWERLEIVDFHDRILGLFNRGYYGRFHDFALPVAWWADPRVIQIKREIVAFLERRMGGGNFGFKDPRTVRLMPMWHQIFGELNLSPKVVLCLRNPAQVARSLQARDGLDCEIGEYRWLVHVADFFRYANSYEVCTIEYEGWFDDRAANLNKLQQFLDLTWHQSEADLELILSEVIDRAARHDDPAYGEANQPLVRSLHKLACRADRDAAARDQVTRIVSQFVAFQQLQKPLVRAFEDVAATADKYAENEQELAALQAALAEREGVIAELADRAEGVAAALQIWQAGFAEQTEASGRAEQVAAPDGALAIGAFADPAAAVGEALARADRAARELTAEVASLRRELAQAEQAGRVRNDAQEALRAAAAAMEGALAQADRWATQQASAAGAMEAEIGALRAALAQAEHQAEDWRVEAQAVQTECVELRAALAQAEHRENHERTAATEAMQARLESLQSELRQAEGERQKYAAAAAAMQEEIETLRHELASTELENHQAGATAAALQARIETLQGEVAQAEQEGQQQAADAAAIVAQVERQRGELEQAHQINRERAESARAMQAQIESLQRELGSAQRTGRERAIAATAETEALRGSLARAEHIATERVAAMKAMQEQIVALQGALTAARQVGKAAIAALRIETAAPAEIAAPRRRRRVIPRIFGARRAIESGRFIKA